MNKYIMLILLNSASLYSMDKYEAQFWEPENLAKNSTIDLHKFKSELQIPLAARILFYICCDCNYVKKMEKRISSIDQAIFIQERKKK